jgi:hypothetical protein
MDQVALADNANHRAIVIDDRDRADTIGQQNIGNLIHGRIWAHRDDV